MHHLSHAVLPPGFDRLWSWVHSVNGAAKFFFYVYSRSYLFSFPPQLVYTQNAGDLRLKSNMISSTFKLYVWSCHLPCQYAGYVRGSCVMMTTLGENKGACV